MLSIKGTAQDIIDKIPNIGDQFDKLFGGLKLTGLKLKDFGINIGSNILGWIPGICKSVYLLQCSHCSVFCNVVSFEIINQDFLYVVKGNTTHPADYQLWENATVVWYSLMMQIKDSKINEKSVHQSHFILLPR